MTTPPSTNTANADAADDEFGERFLTYVDERIAFHSRELTELTEVRRLWVERQTKKEAPRDDAR